MPAASIAGFVVVAEKSPARMLPLAAPKLNCPPPLTTTSRSPKSRIVGLRLQVAGITQSVFVVHVASGLSVQTPTGMSMTDVTTHGSALSGQTSLALVTVAACEGAAARTTSARTGAAATIRGR